MQDEFIEISVDKVLNDTVGQAAAAIRQVAEESGVGFDTRQTDTGVITTFAGRLERSVAPGDFRPFEVKGSGATDQASLAGFSRAVFASFVEQPNAWLRLTPHAPGSSPSLILRWACEGTEQRRQTDGRLRRLSGVALG